MNLFSDRRNDLLDYTEEFDSGWSALLDDSRRRGERAGRILIPWGPHESIKGVRDFSKSPRLRLERFLGMAHERGLQLDIVLGFPPIANTFPQWTNLDTEKTSVPFSCFDKNSFGFLMSTVPSLQDTAVQCGFQDFVSEVASILSLYRSPEGPVRSLEFDFGLYRYALTVHQSEQYSRLLAERYGDIKQLNLLYGTYFRDFDSLRSDGALRSMVQRRPWLLAYDYHWTRSRLLQRCLSRLLELPSMVPLLGLVTSPSAESVGVSSTRILFDATMLNIDAGFAPAGICCPSYSLTLELYRSAIRFAGHQGLSIIPLSEDTHEEVFDADELVVFSGKFLQKRHWSLLSERLKSGTKVLFPLDVPHYDENMERFEMCGSAPMINLRNLIMGERGEISAFLRTLDHSSEQTI